MLATAAAMRRKFVSFVCYLRKSVMPAGFHILMNERQDFELDSCSRSALYKIRKSLGVGAQRKHYKPDKERKLENIIS